MTVTDADMIPFVGSKIDRTEIEVNNVRIPTISY